eukprot:Pgem_evm2s15616
MESFSIFVRICSEYAHSLHFPDRSIIICIDMLNCANRLIHHRPTSPHNTTTNIIYILYKHANETDLDLQYNGQQTLQKANPKLLGYYLDEQLNYRYHLPQTI